MASIDGRVVTAGNMAAIADASGCFGVESVAGRRRRRLGGRSFTTVQSGWRKFEKETSPRLPLLPSLLFSSRDSVINPTFSGFQRPRFLANSCLARGVFGDASRYHQPLLVTTMVTGDFLLTEVTRSDTNSIFLRVLELVECGEVGDGGEGGFWWLTREEDKLLRKKNFKCLSWYMVEMKTERSDVGREVLGMNIRLVDGNICRILEVGWRKWELDH
ncbi:uncharacterized protein HKW66_Vig0122180 [Vigna angularis]|uniref:Uncharacterized protein n=1 Tax=Phaseolus angularis TaxID=3914 RepID=A0A8T0JX11_PHAAN|nr:uncharacterized protein HKW66_Vig0122180 [Vigna angularis]